MRARERAHLNVSVAPPFPNASSAPKTSSVKENDARCLRLFISSLILFCPSWRCQDDDEEESRPPARPQLCPSAASVTANFRARWNDYPLGGAGCSCGRVGRQVVFFWMLSSTAGVCVLLMEGSVAVQPTALGFHTCCLLPVHQNFGFFLSLLLLFQIS